MMVRRELLALAVLVAFFVSLALAAVDYGDQHWDEPTNVKNVAWAFSQRAPTPRYYYYPTGMSWVLAAAALPEVAAAGLDGAPALMMEKPYRLRARKAMALLSAFVVLGTWGFARAQRRGPSEALLAAALVATSWSLVSHARFLATDAINVACAVCGCAALARYAEGAGPRWRLAAAVLVGLAAGTKWVPGVLMIPLIIAAVMHSPAGTRLRSVAHVVLPAAAALVATTPGLVLEPQWVMKGMAFQGAVYAAGWIGYSVSGPVGVVEALSAWALAGSMSPWMPVNVALLLLAAVGVFRLSRDPVSTRLPWLFVPLYLAPFMMQHAFIARNMLMLVPFLAVLAARGAFALAAHARVGIAAVALVGAVAVGQAVFVGHAARTILARETVAQDATAAFLRAHADEDFLASPAVRAWFPAHPQLRAEPAPDLRRLLALPDELFVESTWPANDPFLIAKVLGPLEVDLRFSPTWRGPPRVLVLDIARADASGASLSFNPTGPPRPASPHHRIAR